MASVKFVLSSTSSESWSKLSKAILAPVRKCQSLFKKDCAVLDYAFPP